MNEFEVKHKDQEIKSHKNSDAEIRGQYQLLVDELAAEINRANDEMLNHIKKEYSDGTS